jgi:DUF1680 family protein
LGQYVCSTARDGVYVHLYVGGDSEFAIGGRRVSLKQETEYPWKEQVGITVQPESPFRFTVALRIPGWCRGPKLRVNGKPLAVGPATRKGYACIRRVWQRGDRIELTLPMPVERIEAHPAVRMDCGKVALQRGPVVYCLEEADNGPHLADVFLPRSSKLTAEFRPKLLGGVVVIRGKARRRDEAGWGGELYYAWANRRPGEMLVWIRGD